MKRQILTIAAVLALVFAGAVFAQSANTTPPGPTVQQQPNLTNNDEPNPGTQVPNPNAAANQPVQGTATATETPVTDTQLHPETEPTTGPVDVDVDTGAKAQGAVDVDVTTHPDADTDASGTGTETTTTTTSGAYDTTNTTALPSTASDLPTVALIGLLALGAAFVLRLSKRNA
jgi:LPXTG-motif cell wall-anchored protein